MIFRFFYKPEPGGIGPAGSTVKTILQAVE